MFEALDVLDRDQYASIVASIIGAGVVVLLLYVGARLGFRLVVRLIGRAVRGVAR